MSFRGRGRGRGGFGGGRGFARSAKDEPFQKFPEVKGLGIAPYSPTPTLMQLVRWSAIREKQLHLSPFYHEDKNDRPKRQKLDIERYSDIDSQAIKAKPPLWDVIHLDTDHMVAELARGGARRVKKLKLTGGSDWKKLDRFEELEKKQKGEGGEKNEDDEEEEDEVAEEDGELSDDGDYEQGREYDDDDDQVDEDVDDGNDDEY